jgi:hypothetical protein
MNPTDEHKSALKHDCLQHAIHSQEEDGDREGMTAQWIEVRCTECDRDLTEIFYPTEEFFHDHPCEEYAIHTHHEDGDREGMTAQWTEVHCAVCDKDLTEEFYPSVDPHEDFSIGQLTNASQSVLPEPEPEQPVNSQALLDPRFTPKRITSRKVGGKVASLNRIASSYNVSLDELVRRYDGQIMTDSEGLDKGQIFRMIALESSTSLAFIEYCEQQLRSLRHNRDRRTCEEYGMDLIIGWLGEDLLCEILINAGIPVELNAHDSDRNFVSDGGSINAESDLRITAPNTPNIVVKYDWTGWWARVGIADLKPGDYQRVESRDAIFVGVSDAGFLVLISNPEQHNPRFVRYHRFFKKPMWALEICDDNRLTVEQVVAELQLLLVDEATF